jgi:tetraacyldisaccharide 4'-kinase
MRAPRFWYGKSAEAKATAALLSPLGTLYGIGVRFNRNHQKTFQPRAKIICVGNLTLGGTGKTPIAISLAETFLGHGKKTVFLSRGYKGRLAGPIVVDPSLHSAADVGDEPLLLARTATTIVSRKRAAGAAMADALGAELVIMDDGHQNFSLRKDLSIIVIDSSSGFGNGQLFPAGPMREPIDEGLGRADAVIVVGEEPLQLNTFGGPILRARLAPTEDNKIEKERVVAFAGIGRPDKFFTMLDGMGWQICAARSFSDHHAYSENEIRQLNELAEKLKARLLTTEKDLVRIGLHQRKNISAILIRAMFEDPHAPAQLLEILSNGTGTAAT